MYPGVPLSTVNGRFELRSDEMPAGFWCGLHPRDKNKDGSFFVSSLPSHDFDLFHNCLQYTSNHQPSTILNNIKHLPYFNGNSGL